MSTTTIMARTIQRIFGIQAGTEFKADHRWLFGGFWVNTVAQFMFSSVLGVYLHLQQVSPLGIGAIMLIFHVSMRCMGPFCGALVDQLGSRICLVAGTGMAAAGYAATAYAHELWQFALSLCLLGLGLGLDQICRSTLLVQVSTSKDEGNRALAFYYVILNIGASCGPLISAAATSYGISLKVVLMVVSAISLSTGLGFAWLFPFPVSGAPAGTRRASFRGLGIAWGDHKFRTLIIVLPLIWFLFCLMHVCVPVLLMEQGSVSEGTVSAMFSLNAAMVVFLGYRINRWLTAYCRRRKRSELDGIALGAALMGCGLFMLFGVSWAPRLAVASFMAIFTLGELCFVPMVQILVNESIAKSGGTPGPYFGLSTMAWGVGGGASNLLGGYVIGLCRIYGMGLFPAVFGICAIVTAGLYFWLSASWSERSIDYGIRKTFPFVRRPSRSA